jgi:tricorn protease-like protein
MREVLNSKKIIAVAFLLLIIDLILGFTGYAADKQISANGEKTKEILVARDVTLQSHVWCGDNTFLVVDKEKRLRVIDLLNSKSKLISNPHNVTLETCTSDGEWLVYSNRQSVRWDKGSYERGVIDFWRYNLKTGKRQKFAVASDGSDMEISPNGTRFFFTGSKPKSFIKQPEPKWDLVWSKGSRKPTEVKWLNDSSSIVILSMNRLSEDKLLIEEPDKNSIRQFNIDLGLIEKLRIDKSNRIYLLASPKPPIRISSLDLQYRLQRCSIKGENLDCEDVLKHDKGIANFAITPDGKKIFYQESVEAVTPNIEIEGLQVRAPVAFTWREKTCIWLFEEGTPEVKCITPNATGNSVFSVSPNGRWLVFRSTRIIEKTKTHDIVASDLYLIDLANK